MSKKEIAEAKECLLQWLKPGDTVHCILRYVSKSGMSRDISLLVLKDGEAYYLNYAAGVVLGHKVVNRNGHDAIRIGGCGMDMGFALVYELSYRLFQGTTKDDAGYSLKHHWL